MTSEVAKKAFELAEKELEEKQIEKLKDVVKDTLRKIKDLDDEIGKLEEDRKILKLDIDDLKAGRLDKIEERQKVDKKAKRVSVIVVEKEVHHHHYDRWHQPYVIHYVPYYPQVTPTVHFPLNPVYGCHGGGQTAVIATGLAIGSSTLTSGSNVFSLNASTAKNYTSGTYDLGTKTVFL